MMKKHLAIFSLTVAGLCAVPILSRAEDPVPPKPPGGDQAPPPAEKPAAQPEGQRRGPGGPGGRMQPGERLKMMKEKLGLTDEQEAKIKEIFEKNAPEMRELMAKGRENLIDADKEKLREMMRSQMEEMGAILTPEQKEKMKELRGTAGDRKPGEGRKKRPDAQ